MNTLLTATRRTRKLIGRSRAMETIQQAVCDASRRCRIVFIQGKGGFGKTRLLEETLWRLGNESERRDYPISDEHRRAGLDWCDLDRQVAADLIDLIDTRLHSRNYFLRAVRNSLRWMQAHAYEFNFNTYDAALATYERRVLDNVEYRLTQEAALRAIDAFWEDYEHITHTRRVIWALDTAEQLSGLVSKALIDEGLLTSDQLQYQTQMWLNQAIRQNKFANTTLLLAGRDVEGEAFFKEIEKAAQDADVQIDLIHADSFSAEEVQQYFQSLAEDWNEQGQKSNYDEDIFGKGYPEIARGIANAMRSLANNPERCQSLHLFTGGQAVRLALFSDLIVESRHIPEALKVSVVSDLTVEEKDKRQWELEEAVVQLLFSQPRFPLGTQSSEELSLHLKEATLRRDILLALVRARMGLNAEQIHYVIDNTKSLNPQEWKRVASRDRIRQIAQTMQAMQELAIIKVRPGRYVSQKSEDDDAENIPDLILGLQDEVYRIFAEHMAPHIHPGKPIDAAETDDRARLQRLWNAMPDLERQRYDRNYKDEMEARRDLYLNLREWIDEQRQILRKQLREILEEEEQVLESDLYLATPANPRAVRLRLSEQEQDTRVRLRQNLRELELEYMHYALLLDPELELNDAYFDLADERWWANDEDADLSTQAEMWRILHDRYALRFVNWREARDEMVIRAEEPVDVIRRAARLEDASRWIKRLALRRQYADAVRFADRLEDWIERLPDGHDKKAWKHSFARSERVCWREWACILPGQGAELLKAIDRLKPVVMQMEQLAHKTIFDEAIPETGEKGFVGHPAYTRLKRVLSVAYANMAYGCTQLGRFRQAVEYYSRALDYVRELGAKAHHATVLNNMSRALSEMGRSRALRMCLDALGLRQQLGADAPIGLSHSTLALIYNDQNNPDRAWVEAAKAMVFFQRVNDPRGRGLAALHLGEALRRMAVQGRFGRALPVTEEGLSRSAEDILNEALDIFTKEELSQDEINRGKVREPLRWIEVRIEKGCLYRDRLYSTRKELPHRNWRGLYSAATGLFNEAINESKTKGWDRLELDARVNLAWTHYFANEFDKTDQAIAEAKNLISHIIDGNADLIVKGRALPSPTDYESFILYQLSKLHGLRGRMALDRFMAWVAERAEEIKQSSSRHEDPKRLRQEIHRNIQAELQLHPHHLDEAADGYLLGITYAQLFSPRSMALSALYDTLYDYLKHFNTVELRAFNVQIQEHYLNKPKLQIALEDFGDVGKFIIESLGTVSE